MAHNGTPRHPTCTAIVWDEEQPVDCGARAVCTTPTGDRCEAHAEQSTAQGRVRPFEAPLVERIDFERQVAEALQAGADAAADHEAPPT